MYIIDRFEGNQAVVESENNGTFNLPCCILPGEISEGDVINIQITVDTEATLARRKQAKTMLENFFDE